MELLELPLTEPEPGAAMPVEAASAFMLPLPLKPLPLPAPCPKYFLAGAGMAGRASHRRPSLVCSW